MKQIARKEFVQGVAALSVATAAGISSGKGGNHPGGSLHDVYVVEIEGVYEG